MGTSEERKERGERREGKGERGEKEGRGGERERRGQEGEERGEGNGWRKKAKEKKEERVNMVSPTVIKSHFKEERGESREERGDRRLTLASVKLPVLMDVP